MKRAVRVSTLVMLCITAVTCMDSPVTPITPPSTVAPPLDSATLAGLRAYEEGGCAVSAPVAGEVRGMAIPRQRLPFDVRAVERNPQTGRTNGRDVRLRYRQPDGTSVTMNCWVPQATTLQDLATSLKQSRDGRWRVIADQLKRQKIVPPAENRSPPSPEALAIVGADPTAQRGAAFDRIDETCVVVDIEFQWYDTGGTWHSVTISFEVCYSNGGGDAWAWMVSNGYHQYPYAYIDADKYLIYQTDSVVFTVDYYTGGVDDVDFVGYEWNNTSGFPDPWTNISHCYLGENSCRVKVHGSGMMEFSFFVDQVYVWSSVKIEAIVPDDVGDDAGDAEPPLPGPGSQEETAALNGSSDKQVMGPYAPESAFFAPVPGPITSAQSVSILFNAFGMGEWRYTQGCAQGCDVNHWEPAVDLAAQFGDCTDFVWKAVKNVLGSSWPYSKMSTSMFNTYTPGNIAAYGYVEMDSATARPGDVVVRAKTSGCMCGHAGFFLGFGAGGNVIGWANNGSPARASTGQENDDNPTGKYNFKAKAGYVTRYFRPSTT